MAVRLGIDARLYRNTGNPGSALWQLVANVRDLTLNLESGEADATTRGSAGWQAAIGTLKEASLEFEIVGDSAGGDFAAFQSAFLGGTDLELLVADGDMGVAPSQGLRAVCRIINFTRAEPLEEAITVSVTAKPTYSTIPPSWLMAPIVFDA